MEGHSGNTNGIYFLMALSLWDLIRGSSCNSLKVCGEELALFCPAAFGRGCGLPGFKKDGCVGDTPLPPPIHGQRLHLLHGQTDVGLWDEWLCITTIILVLRPLSQAGFHKDSCQGFEDWNNFKKLTRPKVTIEVPGEGLTVSGFTVEPGMLKRTMDEPEKALSSLTPYRKFCLWDRCAAREWPLTFTRLLCVCSKTYKILQ